MQNYNFPQIPQNILLSISSFQCCPNRNPCSGVQFQTFALDSDVRVLYVHIASRFCGGDVITNIYGIPGVNPRFTLDVFILNVYILSIIPYIRYIVVPVQICRSQ